MPLLDNGLGEIPRLDARARAFLIDKGHAAAARAVCSYILDTLALAKLLCG